MNNIITIISVNIVNTRKITIGLKYLKFLMYNIFVLFPFRQF